MAKWHHFVDITLHVANAGIIRWYYNAGIMVNILATPFISSKLCRHNVEVPNY